MALYVDEGLFPGNVNSFKMTAVGIDKSAIQNMMRNSATYDLSQIKEVFEYFLGVSVEDCRVQLRERTEDSASIADIKRDYQKALSSVKKMSTAEFFNAKMTAQRNGIVKNIANCESRIESGTLDAVGKIQLGINLSNYRQDLELWDSLLPDERLYFVVKSMADYIDRNYNYYQEMEKSNESGVASTFDRLLNMSHGKRNPAPILVDRGDLALTGIC